MHAGHAGKPVFWPGHFGQRVLYEEGGNSRLS